MDSFTVEARPKVPSSMFHGWNPGQTFDTRQEAEIFCQWLIDGNDDAVKRFDVEAMSYRIKANAYDRLVNGYEES